MTSVAAALRRHAPEYLAGLPDTKANIPIRKAFAAIMRCRTGQLGGVHHFMVTFTVPQELREVLRVHRRSGYEALFAASSASLVDVARGTKSLRGGQLGFFGVLQTWGRDPLVYHPHIHYLVPGGGVVVDSAGKPTTWQQTPQNFLMHHGTLIDVFKAKLADELRERGLYALVSAIAWTKKFVVDIEAVEDGRSVVAYLAPYIHRVAISDHRINEVTNDSVTYIYKPTKLKEMRTRKVSGQEFVEGFAQHVLPTGFHKVRYFGWMTSTSKTKLEEIRMIVWFTIGWIYWLASGHAKQPEPIKRPQLRCRVCGSTMRVVLIINTPIPLLLLEHGWAYLDSS